MNCIDILLTFYVLEKAFHFQYWKNLTKIRGKISELGGGLVNQQIENAICFLLFKVPYKPKYDHHMIRGVEMAKKNGDQ